MPDRWVEPAAAATACQGLYSNELRLFRAVLGDDVDVDRAEYLITGDRRCAYRVRRSVGDPAREV